MLKALEKLFGFRTTPETNVDHYLKRMDEMSKFDNNKRNKLLAALIDKMMTLEERVDSLEQLNQIRSDEFQKLEELVVNLERLSGKPVESKDHTRELATIKADITRIKKKVYPAK